MPLDAPVTAARGRSEISVRGACAVMRRPVPRHRPDVHVLRTASSTTIDRGHRSHHGGVGTGRARTPTEEKVGDVAGKKRTTSTIGGRPLDRSGLKAIDTWWRAANYLSV